MQQAVKNISSGGNRGGRRFNYFGLEDGESIILRFITDVDEIVTCDFYEYVKTKTKDKDGNLVEGSNSFIVAPDYYADDDTFQGEDWVAKYGGKVKEYGATELTDPKPKERTVAIAVEREAVPVENAKGGRPKFKYQDKIVEIEYKDKDGNEKKALGRNFILIRKDAKTFWGNIVGYPSEFGTLVDRDYKITRNGKQLATNYATIPVGEGDEWEDIEEFRKTLQARYGYGGKDAEGKDIEKDSEDRFLYCPMTLAEWCEDQASEDRAKTLLTGQSSTPAASSNGSAPSTNGSAAPSDDSADEAQAAPAPAAGDVSALRARLEAHQ